MIPPDDNKKALRTKGLTARRALCPEEWKSRSAAIVQHVLSSRLYANCDMLLSYVASKDSEADTSVIIDDALSSNRSVLVPVLTGYKGIMRWSQIFSRKELVFGRFGLLEPQPEHYRFCSVHETALCLVPGICFTRSGQRLGYGGGYFDRFLDVFSGISVGIAFEMQLVSELPCSPLDRNVNWLATENGLFKCRL